MDRFTSCSDVPDHHVERSVGDPLGFGVFRRTDGCVENAHHATQARDRALRLVEDLSELGHRLEKAVGEEDETHHRA
jgi:hypothetical protein